MNYTLSKLLKQKKRGLEGNPVTKKPRYQYFYQGRAVFELATFQYLAGKFTQQDIRRKGNHDTYLNMEVSGTTYCRSHLVKENNKEYVSLPHFTLFTYYFIKSVRKRKKQAILSFIRYHGEIRSKKWYLKQRNKCFQPTRPAKPKSDDIQCWCDFGKETLHTLFQGVC